MHAIPDPIARAIEAASVPALPQALLRLLRLVDDDSATAADLARAVEQDPGLCTRLLTAANSPALRRGTDLASIESCVIALGTRMVRSIATCLSVQNVFNRAGHAPRVDLAGFWCHSLHVAETARLLAASDGYPNPDHAYLAGLLHDIGLLVIMSARPDDYRELVEQCTTEADLPALETARFGASHCEIGAWLIDRWNLDDSFADGVLFHHEPAEQIEACSRLPQIVWLAHALVADPMAASGLTPLVERIFGRLVAGSLEGLCDESLRSMAALAAAVGVATGDPADLLDLDPLPHIGPAPSPSPEAAAHAEIDARIGTMAAIQPLQTDLFTVESDTELLLCLRESARILFDLSRTAFLFLDPESGLLSGKQIGDQHAVFRRTELRPAERHCLAALAIVDGRIRSTFETPAPPVSLLDRQFLRALASEGLLCVPMIARQRSVGVMIFGISATQSARLARRLPWLLNFARVAASSLEVWQDARAIRQRAAREASERFERQARRLAHEAANPLGIIKGYLRLLDGRLPPETGVREELGVLREEIDRVDTIVRRMSELPPARAGADGFDLLQLLRDMLTLYRAPLFTSRGIEVECRFAADVAGVSGDRDSATQILLNLWKNIAEAMPDGGRLEIGVAAAARNGVAGIEVTLDDNGRGISPELASNLARPEIAPRTDGRGIGLSIVGALAARAGFEVAFAPRDTGGTRTTLFIPAPSRR